MRNCIKALFVSVILMSLTACVNTGCNDYQAYRSVKSSPPINVPDDLEQPDNESLAPEATANADQLKLNSAGECLDKPPKVIK